ncbi:Cell division protein FtsI/penicillin-binding protein 2 [Pedococcus dokdonensis]|uniref:Cell division protein FtsI/penicillin-binding protein 2 n=1 Tax=Pedococcus dokdonensis TaxID=443156 RepID=A0A1H0U2F1_9MICO|nr:penicillin-binding transpeptidase domain-containing protein [Pedococcus dokdonensis]SDP60175.1 Cell division protein FtsI/penicillin-binding protein 2 [Pedococcus dokdonensis]
MRTRAVVGGVSVVALVAAAAGAGLWWHHQEREKELDAAAREEVGAFASSWSGRSFTDPGIIFTGTRSDVVQADFTKATAGLGSGPVKVTADGVRRTGDRATATAHVAWTLAGGVTWSYDVPVTVELAETGGDRWAVTLPKDHAQWHPELKTGATLTAKRTWGERGTLLDRDGEALTPIGKVYPVQIDPSRATAATVRELERVVDEPAGSLVAKLAAATKAGSKAPIPVITYRQSDFDERKAALDALKGVIYPAREQPLAKTRTFGQPLLGSFGAVTAEQITRSKGRYAAGDYAGLSGLQGQYDAVLGGTAGVQVTSSTAPDTPIFAKDAVPGKDVTTTLSPTVQDAAESALASTGDVPSALVAVDVKTGDVLASANSPELGFDRAITGHYPPGSAFKIATTWSLLTSGKVSPGTSVTCPKNFVVDGRSYKNFEGESLGTPDFSTDFAHSCNTAFVQLSTRLGDDDLAKAAGELGLTGWAKTLGVANAFDASIPDNNGKTDKASASIGQGRNVVSPLALAVLAGNVARGSTIAPALVTDPAVDGADRTPKELDAKVVGQLRTLMGEVVSSGTATVLRGTPGGTVRGKTGTAEFGSKNPPETHAWFVGYQGDVAFAVLVEQGSSGGSVAAPVAKKFLTALAR